MQSLGFYNLLIFFFIFFYVIITFEFLFILSIAYLHKLLRIYIFHFNKIPTKEEKHRYEEKICFSFMNKFLHFYNRCDFWAISIHTMVYYTRNIIMLYLGIEFHWLNIQNDI